VQQRLAAACQRAGRSPQEVTVVAVAKGFPPEAVREAYAAGLRHFGENRVQEAAAKRPLLADLDITWHLVGHLQTNKVKKALQLFDIVHSLDSLPLAQELSRRAQGPLPVLLEVNVAGEASKFGLAPEQVPAAAQAIARLPHLELVGLMTVAPMASDPEEVRPVFRRLRELAQALGLPHLSMGMSDDFEVAVEEGATMVRLGRAIFGPRPQP
jgi:pyridoxal phosphate enzyme (YggS family)